MELARIYHNWEKWEDYKFGFYETSSVKNKDFLIQKVIELFSNHKNTEFYMDRVIKEWKNSCEHNLTNLSLNRIAYIGQAACCIYAKVPFQITMNAWNKVDINFRIIADSIANKKIKEWEQNQKLKNTLKIGKKKGIKMEYQTKFHFQ
jgi:hypothetical protein